MAQKKTPSTTAYDATAEDAYWRSNYSGRPYFLPEMDYEEDYLPAYRYGLAVNDEYEGKPFTEVTTEAEKGWKKAAGKSRLSWDQAMPAVQDAFDRVIQLREERMVIDKKSVQTGEVVVTKQVKTTHKTMDVPVEHEEVVISRRAVNKPAASGDIKAEEITIPVSAEKVTVSKDTVVMEEVEVGKRKVKGSETVKADLKHEELVVESEGKAKVRETYKRNDKK